MRQLYILHHTSYIILFRFKQFSIRQDRTAMKVCTDACVLGAYADVSGERILDVGTGTGLLALMAAQRNPPAQIDAVEMDQAAFGQAVENVAGSPFADRVRVWHGRVQDFSPQNRYDRILTNPPFYTNHLRSPDAAVNRALHTDELPFGELVAVVQQLLKPDGQWWVLLPPYEMDQLTTLARTSGLFPFRQLHLRHNANKPVFRVVAGFAFAPTEVAPTDVGATNVSVDLLTVYEPDNRTHTPVFRALLRDFYRIF